jgi:signal transduction histidine kinase
MDLEAVSRLLSLTSHELRSPLGVIRGYLKFLEQQGQGLSDQQRQVIASSLKATDRMIEILGEVSALAHLQRSETPIDKTPTALVALVDAVIDQLSREGASSLRRGAVPDGHVLADIPLLTPALATLAAAAAAARPREPELTMSAHLESVDGAPVVRIDIAARSLASSALNEMPLNLLRGGLGLRLPLAAVVIEVHGGRVRELQESGQLAGMVAWLPVVHAEERRTQNEEQRTERAHD